MSSRSSRLRQVRPSAPACEPLEARLAFAVGVPSFVADINTAPSSGDPGLGPASSFVLNSARLVTTAGTELVVFSSTAGSTGRELWVTDGTTAGTSLVADIQRGPESSVPTDLAACGNHVYFAASDGTHGRELWRTDGTPAGTSLVKDIFVGGEAEPSGFVALPNGTVLFTATALDPDGGQLVRGLWRSDGTSSGTIPIRQAGIPVAVDPGPLTVFGTVALFAADEPGAPGTRVLWVTDGTPGNTAPLLFTNAPVESPQEFAVVEGPDITSPFVLFTASTAVGTQLWKYDSVAGVTFVAQFTGDASELTRFGNGAVFSARSSGAVPELWTTDGTSLGTGPLRRRDASAFIPILNPTGFTVTGGALFFRADGTGGTQLWRSLGSETNTAPVGPIDSTASGFVGSGGRVYFVNFDGQSREVWSSDGAAIGILREIHPFGDAVSATGLQASPFGSGLLFSADDGVNGRELWGTDGTNAGTLLVSDLDPSSADAMNVGADVGIHVDAVVIGDDLYFAADEGEFGMELWRRQGDAAPRLVADLIAGETGARPNQFTVAGTRLFFTTIEPGFSMAEFTADTSFALWSLDTSVPGDMPTRLKDGVISSSTRDGTTSPIAYLMPIGGSVVFAADDGNGDVELWISDGELGPGHTRLLSDINAVNASHPGGFAPMGSRVLFTADDGAGRELWVTDGTEVGTTLVTRIGSGLATGSDPINLTAIGSRVYFSADDGQIGREVWVSDGTSGGTRLVRDINPAPGHGSDPYGFVSAGGTVVFAANDGVVGTEPWSTDGTDGNTRLLVDINPSSAAGSLPIRIVQAGAKVFFSADDGSGQSPWVSDGSTTGTRKLSLGSLADATPDAATFLPGGEFVYFTAMASGRRSLFATDGSSAGTSIVPLGNGLPTGFTGSRAVLLASSPDRLYLAVDDGVHGEELWQIDVPSPPAPPSAIAIGSDGGADKWDREFAYSIVDGTRIRIAGLTKTQSGFFSQGMPLSLLPVGALSPSSVMVAEKVYDSKKRSAILTLTGTVPSSAAFGTLVVGTGSVPGARLINAHDGSTVFEVDGASLVAAGYATAFASRFQGGLRVTAGDVDADGFPDMAVVPGGVPIVDDPLAPGTRLSATFGSSRHRAAVFLSGTRGATSFSIDVNANGRFGDAAEGYLAAIGDVLADHAGSGSKELIVASGNRLAVFDILAAPAGGQSSFSDAVPRVVDLPAGSRISAVATGAFFATGGGHDLVVASTTASIRSAGTTTISIYDGGTLQLRTSFPIVATVQSGPGRRMVNVFGYGASLAVGDIDGDLKPDLVMGAGANGLGNFRVLGHSFITSSTSVTSATAYRAAIVTQLGPQGDFGWQRTAGSTWKPSGGPDFFMPLDVPGPLGRGFNAPLSVATAVGIDGRTRIFAAIGANNTTGNEVRRFLFDRLNAPAQRWTGETAFTPSPSAGGTRFRLGGGLRIG